MGEQTRIRQPTREENQLRRLMQIWTGLFGTGAVIFLLIGDRILEQGNWIGSRLNFPPMPLPTERFWLSLTISMMATITALAYYVQKDVRMNKKITVFILIAKLTSTLALMNFFFADARYFNYLMGSVFCDGPIFIITFILYRRAL